MTLLIVVLFGCITRLELMISENTDPSRSRKSRLKEGCIENMFVFKWNFLTNLSPRSTISQITVRIKESKVKISENGL